MTARPGQMAAELLGTTGNWGIPLDEAGIIITDLNFDFSNQEKPETAEEVSASTLIPAFVISELRTAFIIGFIIFVPFLVIDLIVSAVLMSMGMVMLPPVFISLPLKLLVFVLVDGWALIVGSVVQSVNGVV